MSGRFYSPGGALRASVERRAGANYSPWCMWREFTKETPGRPWLALISSAMALAGTTALAQYMTQARGHPKAATFVFSLPGWPVSVRLPEGARRTPSLNEPVNSEGTRGELRFRLAGARQERGELRVYFQCEDSSTSLEQAFHALTGLSADDGEEIAMGPLSGLWSMGATEDGAIVLTAVATTAEGLTIQVEITTTAAGARQRKEFEEICSSVEYKSWAVRSRE